MRINRKSSKRSRPGGMALGLLIVLAMVAAACGGDKGSSKATTDTTGGSAGTSEVVKLAGDVPGVTNKVIKLGATAPLSGPAAGYGVNARNGMDLAVEHINKAGGVLGRQLEIVWEDDTCDAAAGSAAARKLIDQEQVFAMVGGACSNSALPIAQFAQSQKIPYIVCCSTTPALADPLKSYVFQPIPDSKIESEALVKVVTTKLTPKTAAFLYETSDYGNNSVTITTGLLEKTAPDVKIVATEGFPQGTTDFTPGLLKLQSKKPDVTFVVGSSSGVATMLKQAGDLGIETHFVGFGAIAVANVVRSAGSILDGVYSFYYTVDRPATDSPSKPLAEMVTAYKAKYGDFPDQMGIMGYHSILLFEEAAKRAGAKFSRDGFVAALETLDGFETGLLPPTTFTADDHSGVDRGVLLHFLKGREETTSLYGNFELLSP